MNAGQFAKRRALIDLEEHRRGKGYRSKALAALMREAGAEAISRGGKVVGWKLPNQQVACKKERHASVLNAMIALESALSADHSRKRPVRYYHCEHCDGWHLTSQK